MAVTVDSAGKQQLEPADLTGLMATAVDSASTAAGPGPSMQPMEQQQHGQGDQGGLAQGLPAGADGSGDSSQGASHETEAAAEGSGAEPIKGLADPNKRMLAKMGSARPADVSKQLLQQMAAQSDVQSMMQVSCGTL